MSTQTDAMIDETVALVPDVSAEELTEMMMSFLSNGTTLREMKGLTKENMEAIYTAGYNAYNGGNLEQAHKVFQFLCYFDHLEKKYWMGLGACRQLLKKYKEAIDAYSFAAMLDMDDPRPPLQAADCHLALGNYDAAVSGFNAAIAWSGDKAEYQAVKQRAEQVLEIIEEKKSAQGT